MNVNKTPAERYDVLCVVVIGLDMIVIMSVEDFPGFQGLTKVALVVYCENNDPRQFASRRGRPEASEDHRKSRRCSRVKDDTDDEAIRRSTAEKWYDDRHHDVDTPL